MLIKKQLLNILGILRENRFITFFVFSHIMFAAFLGRLYALAPDENGYINTFNSVYSLPISTSAQTMSGWIAAPTIFLWIIYLPAKVLSMLGVPDYLSVRILSIILASFSLYLLRDILIRSSQGRRISRYLILSAFFIPSIFLWTSVGLRESFIIAELMAFLAGINFLMEGKISELFTSLFRLLWISINEKLLVGMLNGDRFIEFCYIHFPRCTSAKSFAILGRWALLTSFCVC